MTSKLLMGINSTFSYADDLITATNEDFEHHLQELETLFKAIRSGNLRLRPEKIQICEALVSLLGMDWSLGSFRVPIAQANAIIKHKKPTTCTGIRSFIFFTAFFRRFILDHSRICLPMLKLIRGDPKKVVWTNEADLSFDKIKESIANSFSITCPGKDVPIFLCSDASDDGIGGAVWFLDGPEKEFKFIGSASRIWQKNEMAYPTYQKELYALLHILSTYKYLLTFASKITCFVDAKALVFLKLCRSSNYALTRLSMALSLYNLEIRHVPGKLLTLADHISRSRLRPDYTKKCTIDYNPLNKNEAQEILKHIDIPDDYTIQPEILKKILTQESPQSPFLSKANSTKSKVIITEQGQAKDTTKLERKVKKPPMVKASKRLQQELQNKNPTFGQEQYDEVFQSILMIDMEHEENIWNENEESSCINALTIEQKNDVNTMKQKHNLESDHLKVNDFKLIDEPSETLKITSRIIKESQLSFETLRFGQSKDPVIQEILKEVKNDEKYEIHKGVLLKKLKSGKKIVAPTSLLLPLIYTCHYSTASAVKLEDEPGCHTSPSNMLKIISEKFWHPNLSEEIYKFASNCLICMTQKVTSRKSINLGRKLLPEKPRQIWNMDIASGIIETNTFKYVVLYIDSYSLYSVAVPLRSRSQEELLKSFKNHVCSRFSYPKMVYGDKEGGFISDSFKNFCKSRNISIGTSQRDAHWSNGIAETGIRILKQILRLIHQYNGRPWIEYMDYINICMNNRILSTGFSPHELMFGMKQEKSVMLEDLITIGNDDKDYMKQMQEIQENMRAKYMEIRNKKRDADRQYQNKKRTSYTYSKGDIVLLRDLTCSHGGSSMTPRWIGPFLVKNVDQSGFTVELAHIKDNRIRHAHMEYLKSIPNNAGNHTRINMNIQHLLPNDSKTKNNGNNKPEEIVNKQRYNLRSKPISDEEENENSFDLAIRQLNDDQ